MDAATLQARIYSGYEKAARRIGYTFDLYRPTGAGAVITGINKVASLPAAFSLKGDKQFTKAPAYKDVLWEGLLDGSLAQRGDYLFNPAHGTFFVADMPAQLPIVCVRCFHTLSIMRPGSPAVVGIAGYNGTTKAGEAPILVNWPGSVVYAQRGRVTEVGLPMDLPSPYYDVLLPDFADVTLRPSDVVVDELEQRYVVGSAENNELGWRLSAQIAVT